MKLTSIELHPDNSSEVAVLSFRDPKALNPYNVRNVTGLDANEITPKHYGPSDNSNFFNLAMPAREVVMQIGLNPDFALSQTYSDLRDALYKMISSSRTGLVQLQFKNLTTVIAAVSGFVVKFESSNFEKSQMVQITLRCVEPMLQAPARIVVPVSGLSALNTEISDDVSTAPHGFIFEMAVNANIASVVITDPNNPSAWSFTITPTGGFLAGDTLVFSSELNDKKIHIIRGGFVTYLGDVVGLGSVWPILFPGQNHLSFTNYGSLTWNSIGFYPTYWGV